MKLSGQSYPVYGIWAALVIAALAGMWEGEWRSVFVALATLGLTFVPILFEDRFHIKIPVGFLTAIVIFTFATLFLGEVGGFYERYWWWDTVLHMGSAVGFGLIGFVFMFILFGGDRYAAPPIAVATFAFCFALSIGAVWEIFEFVMDQLFGLNMQKSGLVDTMVDLMVDCAGAFIGASAGFLYLKELQLGILSPMIDEFVQKNRGLFKKWRG